MAHPLRGAPPPLLLLAAAAALLLASGAAADIMVFNNTVNDASQFPAARPPLWRFRTLDMSTYAITFDSNKRVLTLTVNHAPLKGINSDMMVWFFANLATGSAVSPLDNQTYPMFLLMHPRDHILHTSTKTPTKNGAHLRFVEFPLTGCNNTDNPTWLRDFWDWSKCDTNDAVASYAKWQCPTLGDPNPGFLKDAPGNLWMLREQTNGTPEARSWSKKSVSFTTIGCNNAGCAKIINTQQTWSYDSANDELHLTTFVKVGSGYTGPNIRVLNGWRNGLCPKLKATRAALHFTEEYGGLEWWLPAAYKAANPPKPGRR